MSVTPSSTVVAAFRDRWAAEQAMEALYNAGFTREQMQYVVPGTGGFFEGLKSFFTGSSSYDSDLAGSLNEMGLSNEEAQYYAGEYDQGNTILAVMTSGRDQEALNILGQYGAYNARAASPSSETTTGGESVYQDVQPTGTENPDTPLPQEMPGDSEAPFPAEVTSEDTTAPFPQETASSDPTAPFPEEVASDKEAPLPEEVASSDPTAPFPPDVREEAAEQADETVAEPVMVEVDEIAVAAVPDTQANVYMPSTDDLKEVEEPGEQESQEAPEIEEVEDAPGMSELDEVEVPESRVGMDASETGAVDEIDEVVTPAYPTGVQEPQQASGAFTGRSTQLQQVLDEIQRTQQQLQEAKAQLEAMRQHEAEYTTAKQQLKDLQDELQAVQAELQATKERLGLE